MSFTEKITVTGAHIQRGQQRAPESCPIALAISEAHPDALLAEVYSDFAALYQDHAVTLSAHLPDAASEFVEHFDDGEPVGPFELELTWEAEEEIRAGGAQP